MKKRNLLPLLTFTATSFLVTSCNNDDNSNSVIETNSTISVKNTTQVKDFVQSGDFYGANSSTPIFPGESSEIKFAAGKGQTLAFATMFGASKDCFFAPTNPGLKLYDTNGNPITGDVSDQIKLWDNGSKNDETGMPESNKIAEVAGIDASQLMKLVLSYNEVKSEFTLTITNRSNNTTHETPFSPGVWAVSNTFGGELNNSTPFFIEDEFTNARIKAIAESGNNSLAVEDAKSNTGIITGLSPLVVVVYNGSENPIFKSGEIDKGNGLSELAQKGHFETLVNQLKTVRGVKDVYVLGNSPILPGEEKNATIKGSDGDKIAFVTMFGYSNDWFFGNNGEISFTDKGNLATKIKLFDNGTAKNQYPGAGNAQALFGGTAFNESINIFEVSSDTYSVGSPNNYIEIKIN